MLYEPLLRKELKQFEVKLKYRAYITWIFLSIPSADASFNNVTLFIDLDSLNWNEGGVYNKNF